MDLKKEVLSIMEKIQFPSDAVAELCEAFHKIDSTEFRDVLALYEADMNCNFSELLSSAAALGSKAGLHEYTAHLLLLLCLSPTLRERYLNKGLSEELFYHSLKDLTYKLNECRLIYGINGTFVADWFRHHFKMELFALGRLQFERFLTRYEYEFEGKTIPIGTRVINIHIPRTGTRLDHNEVLASYKMAEEMFGSEFENEPMLFYCDSWLLDPHIPSFFGPASNLTEFQNDFTIVFTGESREYSALWTVFDRIYNGDVSVLPADTSLRRAYINRIKNNEPFYYGHGLFRYKNGKIIK